MPYLAALLLLATATANAGEGRKLRIVTFNGELMAAPGERYTIQKYRFDIARREHFERVASVIETLNPDVLNLVEIRSQRGLDYLVSILHAKGMKEYRGYHVESNDGFMKLDVALISKIEPDEVDGSLIRTIYADKDGDPDWREGFTFTNYDGGISSSEVSLTRNAVYYMTIGGHKLGFLGLHLKSNPDDSYANGRRSAETEISRRIIRKEIVARGYTPIVLGDLNDYDPDVPDRDEGRSTKTEVMRLMKDYDEKTDGPELVNTASRIPRQEDRYTSHWDRNENDADDIGDVKTMLDHVLLHKSLMPHVTRVFIDHSHGLDTSDHYPVVVDLTLPE